MRTLLALYPGSAATRQAQFARYRGFLAERDVRVVLANDYVAEADLDCFDEVVELPPPEAVSDAWNTLASYLDMHAVHAVFAQSEASACLGALAARRLGVPGISVRAALACTSKLLTRRVLERADIPVPRFALCTNERDVRAFADGDGGGYPIVLKGVASALGRLVTLVRSADEVAAATHRILAGLEKSPDIRRLTEYACAANLELDCDPKRSFLAESFAGGLPVEADGVLFGRKIVSFGVTEQILSPPPRFYIEGYLTPAPRDAHALDAVESVSRRALAALGLSDTGYSIEMRLDGNDVIVIEVNGRLGFDDGFGAMFERTAGADPFLCALEIALGAAPARARPRGAHCAIAYQAHYEDGVVARMPSADELARAAEPGLELGTCVVHGERMYAAPHPDVAPHLAFALAEHANSSREAFALARAAVERLRFEIARA